MKPKPTKAAPVDRRVRRTQRALRDALVSLILERGWDAVTVRDVCEQADVGRSTFYLHFADKESLLLSGFDDLQDALTGHSRDARQPFAFAEPLLAHALENERIFRAVVGRQSGQQMQWRFRDMLVTLLGHDLASMKVPAASRASTACFLAGGFIEQLMGALEHPQGVRAEILAAQFRRLAEGVVHAVRSTDAKPPAPRSSRAFPL